MKIYISILNVVVLFVALSAFSVAKEQSKAVIIFDASGSMWGQVDGKAKISIAKEALQDVVKKWNPDVELGLTVYGHRTKGDCTDIETVVSVDKVDKNKLISIVKNIQPKGKTPISATLKKVAKEMKFSEEKATIILISDGKESCDADPCTTAKELEKQGIDFVAHVIGFNVDKKTDAQLECIADATGGEYFSAKDATALNDAMDSIVKKVEEPKPEPKPVVKDLKYTLEITAVEKEGGKWLISNHSIYKQGEDGKVTGKNMAHYGFKTSKKEPLSKKLPVGKYILKSNYNHFGKETAFEIKASEVTKLNIIFGQTNDVEITAVEKEGGKWLISNHSIYKQGEDGKVTGKNMAHYGFKTSKKEPLSKKLPVGKYILKSEYNSLHKETQFEIKADAVSKINVIFEQFVIKTKCPDMNSNVSYEVYAPTGRMAYSTQKLCSEAVQLTLDAGDYTVEAKIKNDTKEEKFSIGGSSHELVLDMTNLNSKEELIKADTPHNETNQTKDAK